jgi:hypothetical protein
VLRYGNAPGNLERRRTGLAWPGLTVHPDSTAAISTCLTRSPNSSIDSHRTCVRDHHHERGADLVRRLDGRGGHRLELGSVSHRGAHGAAHAAGQARIERGCVWVGRWVGRSGRQAASRAGDSCRPLSCEPGIPLSPADAARLDSSSSRPLCVEQLAGV